MSEYETDLTYTFPAEDGREPPPEDPDPDRRRPQKGGWYEEWDGPTDQRERSLDSGYDPSDPKGWLL